MNNATLSSARLQRVLKVLRRKGEHSTWDIMREAKVAAVSACISELRALGARIDCVRRFDGPEKQARFYYKMVKEPPQNGR